MLKNLTAYPWNKNSCAYAVRNPTVAAPLFLIKGLSGCSAFIVETPIDGNEPVCLHDQGVQVARDEQEESNQVARAED